MADLFSNNVGKKVYIRYHGSHSTDNFVEGIIESLNIEAKVVVLRSESSIVHFGYSSVYIEYVTVLTIEKTA